MVPVPAVLAAVVPGGRGVVVVLGGIGVMVALLELYSPLSSSAGSSLSSPPASAAS